MIDWGREREGEGELAPVEVHVVGAVGQRLEDAHAAAPVRGGAGALTHTASLSSRCILLYVQKAVQLFW